MLSLKNCGILLGGLSINTIDSDAVSLSSVYGIWRCGWSAPDAISRNAVATSNQAVGLAATIVLDAPSDAHPLKKKQANRNLEATLR
jgi:hypothetical protein